MTDMEQNGLTRRTFAGRTAATVGSMTMLGSFLAACGGSDSKDGAAAGGGGGGTMQFWKFASENDDPIIKGAVDRWNKENPDSKVDFQTFPPDQYSGTKLTTAFAAKKGPDVFWISPGAFINYVNNGVAEPVDDLIDKSTYNPASVTAVSVDGKMYSLPFEQEPVALYYRKDILEKAGIEPPRTWDDLRAAAKELTTKKQKGIVIEPTPGGYQNFTWYPFLWSAGGNVLSEDSKKSALNTPEAASAFQLWGDLMKDGYAPKKTAQLTSELGPLGRGEAAMQVCGFWGIGQMKNLFKDVDYGVVKIPAPAGRQSVTVYGGWTQMVNAQGGNVAKAKEFTKWLWVQDKEFPDNWACRNGSKFSPNNAVNEGCEDVFSKGAYKTFRDEVLPTAQAEPRYPDQIVKAIGDGLQAAMFSGKSGEEAASQAAKAIDSYLSSYQGAPLNPTQT
ncbi:MAG TPA: sugar ABC transporter substrate-binding protein [Solirubrobacteraceae bacterium]|nr:sugar ABC transporter substrate-binding protein [Solirubrobacteraceae bacterium]